MPACEVREETGLEVEVVRLLWEEQVTGDRTYQRTKTYLCSVTGGILRPGAEPEAEHHVIEDAAWFPLAGDWGSAIDEDRITRSFMVRLRSELDR